MDIADSVKTYYRIEQTDFPVPMHMKQCNFRPFRWNPLLVKFSPRRLIAREVSMLLQITFNRLLFVKRDNRRVMFKCFNKICL